MKVDNILIIGKRSNLSNQLNQFLEKSILIQTNDLSTVEEILKVKKNIVIIYNSCVQGNRLNSIADPVSYTNYSIAFLSEFIKCSINYISNIKKIIFTSTGAVYGNNKNAKETDPYFVQNLYSSFKISSELLILRYLSNFPIDIIITRIFNMYGGDDNFSVINSMINDLKNNNNFKLNNNGQSIRDFIHVKDICRIYKKIIYSDFKGQLNICTGKGISIIYLKELTEKIFQKKLNLIHSSSNEISISQGSTNKLNKLFGEINYFSLEDYLKSEKDCNK